MSEPEGTADVSVVGKMSRGRLIPVLLIGSVVLGAGVVSAFLMFRPDGQSHSVGFALFSPGRSPILASPESPARESPSPAATTPTPKASPSPKTPTPAASPSPSPNPPAASPAPPPPPPPPPPVPPPATRGIYRFSSTDFATMHSLGFNASTDGGVQNLGAAESANGINGMVWVDAYSNTACTQTMSDAAIAGMVQANVNAGRRGLRYQIADEPTANGCNAAPTYAHMTAVVHGVDSSAKTWVADDQFQVGNPILAGIPMKGSVDILAFDIYPCQSGACDYAAIDRAVQQIHAAGLTNWEFIIQDFSTGPWRWPTPAEIQAQFDHWKNQGAIGYWVFAWDYLGAQVSSQPGNLDALRRLNT